jgi:hypothetical protein
MVARGQVSLHTPPLLGRKSSAAKSNHSHTCAAAPQVKSLLSLTRPPGGGGAFSMTLSPRAPRHSFTLSREGFTLSRTQGPPSSLFPLHTKSSPVTPLFPLLTQKRGSTPSSKNVGAPTFLIFLHIFRSFCGPRRVAVQFAITSWVATSLARAKKLRYAGSVVSGGFPPHSLSVVPLAIQFPVNEG